MPLKAAIVRKGGYKCRILEMHLQLKETSNLKQSCVCVCVCVCMCVKHIFFIQHIYGSCFCIHSASLCLLVGEFSPFAFKVIIDMYVLIALLLIVSDLFLLIFSGPLSLGLFSSLLFSPFAV